MIRTVAVALAVFVGSAAIAEAKLGRCLLRVEGRTYLQGTCNVMAQTDGSFSVGMVDDPAVDGPPSRFFATVNAEDGAMVGYWNGAPNASHAQTPLGKLRRNGACWENASSSVCAWR